MSKSSNPKIKKGVLEPASGTTISGIQFCKNGVIRLPRTVRKIEKK